MNDLISRQAVIDALNGEIEITGRTNAEAVKGYVRLVKDRLERLPSTQPEPSQVARDIATIIENEQDMRVIARSTQPEPLTDKEQRIFLAAMRRERKVCTYAHGPCEVPLTKVCDEIVRKVKGALWT